MKLLINASTLSGTGVTQVAVSFLEECKKITEHTYYVLISLRVTSQIDQKKFPSNFIFYQISINPRFLFKGHFTRNKMRNLENEINPDCVFSIFGPSYWTPKAPHLMGYAYPHYVYPESPIFKIMPLKNQIKTFVYRIIHRYFLKKNGNYYVCETNDVAQRLVKFLKISAEQVFTVLNTYNHYFNDFVQSDENILPKRIEGEFRFLSLCSFEPHKNLEILNQVIPLLNKRLKNIKVKFILTVDSTLLKSKMSVETMLSIINIGRLDISLCPHLYSECDALFLPTLLECFSANYPESMRMRRPILTSNLTFATTVCEKAALYFDPLNAEDIVEKIIAIIENNDLRNELISNGIDQLQSFNSSEERARAYLKICTRIKKNA